MIVDNSGERRAERQWPEALPRTGAHILCPERNIGFGSAVNLAARTYPSEFVAVINDDATADPKWLGELTAAMEAEPRAGSAAAQVRLQGVAGALDSAGMLIAADGTSKQRGHGEPPSSFGRAEEVLLASGSAAIYRTAMLAETGGFDDSFFLYCEDTDLGLRARWAGWTCLYVPGAVAHHRYSHSAGRASRLKAYYVERNRLLTIGKNLPAGRLARAIAAAPLRYLWSLLAMLRGRGAAGAYRQTGGGAGSLAACVVHAHCSALLRIPEIWRQRREVRRKAKMTPAQFVEALERHRISLRKVAEL